MQNKTTPMGTCCEKCARYGFFIGTIKEFQFSKGVPPLQCANHTCDCHAPTPNTGTGHREGCSLQNVPLKYASCGCWLSTNTGTEWESEFDEKFEVEFRGDFKREVFPCEGGYCEMAPKEIKDFIRQTLATQKAQLIAHDRARLVEEVEKLRRTDDTQMSHDHVYDEALDDVIALLKDKGVK